MVSNKKRRGQERRAARAQRDALAPRQYQVEVHPLDGDGPLPDYNENELDDLMRQAIPQQQTRQARQREMVYMRRAWAQQIADQNVPPRLRHRQPDPNMVRDTFFQNEYWEGAEAYLREHPERDEVDVFANYAHPLSQWDYYLLRVQHQFVRLTLLNDLPFFY